MLHTQQRVVNSSSPKTDRQTDNKIKTDMLTNRQNVRRIDRHTNLKLG
jgi:hypothetical protein